MNTIHRASFSFFVLCSSAILAVAAGCDSSHTVPIGMQDGGGSGDGGGGVTCGPTTCAAGEVCCNESCGICTAPGGACPAIACVADGGVDPVPCGPTTCEAGQICCNSRCGICAGPGGACPAIECASDGGVDGGGSGRSCGGLTPDGTPGCNPDEYCDWEPNSCGAADETGICRPRPLGCPDHCPGVCGCDGVTYCNDCDAAAMGIDVIRNSPCEASPCDPMDAYGTGLCDAFWGFAWDGSSCVGVSGCSCVGSDCGHLYRTPDECAAATAGCPGGGGGGTVCGGFIGAPCPMGTFCDYDDGGLCGAADGTGVCRPMPTVCPEIYAPVCACDGMTYSNECDANARGLDVSYWGECMTTPPGPGDCRATGCAMGETCTACFGGWLCLGPDEACAF